MSDIREKLLPYIKRISELEAQLLEEKSSNLVLRNAIKVLEHETINLQNNIKAKDEQIEALLNAPTDNGIELMDSLCWRFNNRKIDILALTCRLWNGGYAAGREEALQSNKAGVDEEAITKAHMAGQFDAGVDPSWSNALAYFKGLSEQKVD